MNVRDLKSQFVLSHKLEPWLHGDVDQKATDDMEVTDLLMNVPYADVPEATVFLTAGGKSYITMMRLHGQTPKSSMEAYKIREGTLVANMDLWVKQLKPAIKRLAKAGPVPAQEIRDQVFQGSDETMRWWLDGYYQGATLFEKYGVEYVRYERS